VILFTAQGIIRHWPKIAVAELRLPSTDYEGHLAESLEFKGPVFSKDSG
jgi:hypothetical protein